jgi:hypothetical protein
MHHRFAAFAIAACLVLPATALAEAPASAAPPHPAMEAFPTFRVDLLGGVMGGGASNGLGIVEGSRRTLVSAAALVPAVKLDLGVQLSERAALFARIEGGSDLLSNEGAAYLVGEWSPAKMFSVGTGVGYESLGLLSPLGGGCTADGCTMNSWSAVSVPLILAIEPRRGQPDGAHGGSWRFEIEAGGGYDPKTEAWGAHGFISVGGTWR